MKRDPWFEFEPFYISPRRRGSRRASYRVRYEWGGVEKNSTDSCSCISLTLGNSILPCSNCTFRLEETRKSPRKGASRCLGYVESDRAALGIALHIRTQNSDVP